MRVCLKCESKQPHSGRICYWCGGDVREVQELPSPAPITTEDEAAVDAAWPESPPTVPSVDVYERRYGPEQGRLARMFAEAGMISPEDLERIRTSLKE